ncbi:MAG: hypothetical protein N2379_07140, partial [Verrucomicrobiae bacterium]|nr:hypothetical protein [Verrucomicrobiae bacterium]
ICIAWVGGVGCFTTVAQGTELTTTLRHKVWFIFCRIAVASKAAAIFFVQTEFDALLALALDRESLWRSKNVDEPS